MNSVITLGASVGVGVGVRWLSSLLASSTRIMGWLARMGPLTILWVGRAIMFLYCGLLGP
ncbi:hypothetical protein BDV38DRAFT_244642 [Aspergillus pseudotamarii]|uniref:Uncharacterized protein n=1 Tax=Aspergillus pseudotamarii TaxID=132259 RepID=A0A5N6SYE8_ASPPS|nr:uncharacterized protein BDV38DRAFT_244642 [Aspergillus pseudotamarii]KAE8138433.1 hypothetical protein BDV38DRAFT_244642 [Aspergillus pseudotamarii]